MNILFRFVLILFIHWWKKNVVIISPKPMISEDPHNGHFINTGGGTGAATKTNYRSAQSLSHCSDTFAFLRYIFLIYDAISLYRVLSILHFKLEDKTFNVSQCDHSKTKCSQMQYIFSLVSLAVMSGCTEKTS